MINAAFMLLRSPSGTVLFLRRAKGEDHSGKFDLPGGKIKAGETPKPLLGRYLKKPAIAPATVANGSAAASKMASMPQVSCSIATQSLFPN
jgi:hypothetical protein